jgi:hypothetical protein
LLVAGVLGRSLPKVTAGTIVLAIGILILLSNFGRVLRHAFRPQVDGVRGPRGAAMHHSR